MDTGLGKIEPISERLGAMFDSINELRSQEDMIPIFRIGETINVKGGTYEVKKIKQHELILKPVGRSTKHLHGETK